MASEVVTFYKWKGRVFVLVLFVVYFEIVCLSKKPKKIGQLDYQNPDTGWGKKL